MEDKKLSRRSFLNTVSTGVAAVGLSTFAASSSADAKPASVTAPDTNAADAWFNQIKGKHRIAYDVVEANGPMPFVWPRVFLMTNEETGTPAKDCNVVVILRHEAMPFAVGDAIWEKYKVGEMLKVDDPTTGKPATRNPFWKPGPKDWVFPAVGPVQIGINQLQESGVMFCVCHMALMVNTAALAAKLKADPDEMLKEWTDAVLPGIQIVPSGVWAVGRAQEHDCAYCYAG